LLPICRPPRLLSVYGRRGAGRYKFPAGTEPGRYKFPASTETGRYGIPAGTGPGRYITGDALVPQGRYLSVPHVQSLAETDK